MSGIVILLTVNRSIHCYCSIIFIGDAAALAEIAAIETANAAAVEARAWRKVLDPTERLAVGRACKVVLDLGRREALRAVGLRCELVRYCGSEITLENRLLLAWRP